MIDGRSRIAGYVLHPKALVPGEAIDGKALSRALAADGLIRFAQRRTVVIPVTRSQWRDGDFTGAIAAGSHFKPLETGALAVDEVLALLGEMRAAGARVALDSGCVSRDARLIEAADLLLFDFHATSLAALEEQVRALGRERQDLALAAVGVQSWAECRLCRSMGFVFCAGPFVSTPDEGERGDRLGQSRMVVIEMLNELRGEADIAAIAATAKRDPAVVVKLLEMANSPLHGLSREVFNLDEAILLLGRDRLYRWLALAMFRVDGDGGRDQTLLVLALCRAAFLEALGNGRGRQQADELFLVGLLSVIDSLLGLGMQSVLEKMRLPDAVVSVLLKSEGPYAKHLSLAIAMERCRLDQASVLGASIGIDMSEMVRCYADAIKLATAELAA